MTENRNRNNTKNAAAIVCSLILLLIISIALVFTSIPSTLAAKVTMEVYQQSDNKAFGNNTSLDIFNNPKLGNQKLIAPYTVGDYTFAVFNNSNSNPLPYTLSFSGTNLENIPLVFSLKKNGEYIYGGENEEDMLPLMALDLSEVMLEGNKTDLFTIKWMWRTESDAIDTALGNDGTQTYSLFINAVGTVSETEVPSTNDYLNSNLWEIIIFISMLMIVFLFLFKRSESKHD